MVRQQWNDSEYPILPLNDSVFYINGKKGTSFTFKNMRHGKAAEMLLSQNGTLTQATRTTDHVKLVELALDQHSGSFYNPEIDAHYIFSKENGKLWVTIGTEKLKVWRLSARETYTINDTGIKITFYKNRNQQIGGFILNHIRVKGLKFTKD